MFSGSTVDRGDAVSVEIDGVVNAPTTGSNETLSVATSADTAPITSAATAAPSRRSDPVTNVTAANNSVAQARARSRSTRSAFTTSSTGGLSDAAGSQILITFPANTDLTGLVGSSSDTTTGSSAIGNCFSRTDVGVPRRTCTCSVGQTIGPGHAVSDRDRRRRQRAQPRDQHDQRRHHLGHHPPSPRQHPTSRSSRTAGLGDGDRYAAVCGRGREDGLHGRVHDIVDGRPVQRGRQPDPDHVPREHRPDRPGRLLECHTSGSSAIATAPPSAATRSSPAHVQRPGDRTQAHGQRRDRRRRQRAPHRAPTRSASTPPQTPPPGYQHLLDRRAQPRLGDVDHRHAAVAAAGAKSVYTVGFTTSSTGGLSDAAGSQILITFPANTDLSGLVGSSVADTSEQQRDRQLLPVGGDRSSPAHCSAASRSQATRSRRDRRRRQRAPHRHQHDQRRHHLRHPIGHQHLLDRRRTADQPAGAAAEQHCRRRRGMSHTRLGLRLPRRAACPTPPAARSRSRSRRRQI